LEAWQGFVKAREENQAKPYEIRITARISVDMFQEVGSTMTHVENREVFISEGDIILFSQSKNPSADEPTCLARVFRVKRKQQHIEVAYRVVPGNPLSSALQPNNTLLGTKLQSITPLEREYGALKGLQYYDLCDEIINARPSPLLAYKDTQIQPLISNYNVNKAQAKAIKSAIDNDAFTLIQGYVSTHVSSSRLLTVLQTAWFRKDQDYHCYSRSHPYRQSSQSRYGHQCTRSTALGSNLEEAAGLCTQ
jgi:senataxin